MNEDRLITSADLNAPTFRRSSGITSHAIHLTARVALDSLVAADALSFADRCRRCGGSDTVVEVRAARFESRDLRP